MHKRFDLLRALIYLLVAALCLIMLYGGLKIWESYRNAQGTDTPTASKTIVRDGVEYFPRQDITVFLVLGIDEFGPAQESQGHQNPGAADMVSLVVIDETAKKINLLSLNRDTMLQMPVLGIGGKPAGTYYGQLALAHTFGTGLEDSCENTKKAVSDFLYGLRIDYYVSMKMDAVQILNDAVGGVQVHVTDDFSKIDASIPMGDVLLQGRQALTFIRGRKDLGDQLNVSRIQRQNHYIERFAESLQNKVEQSDSFVLDTYGKVEDYLVTDCSATALNAMLRRYSDYTLEKAIMLEGENRVGEQYMEFYVDEQKLDDTILSLFYAPK